MARTICSLSAFPVENWHSVETVFPRSYFCAGFVFCSFFFCFLGRARRLHVVVVVVVIVVIVQDPQPIGGSVERGSAQRGQPRGGVSLKGGSAQKGFSLWGGGLIT